MKFVTTRAEYQWDGERYVLESKDGYWYDGEWAMAGVSGPTPPPVPGPLGLSQQDASFNRIDQNTPFGSLTFSGPNRNQADLSLSPEVQGLFDQRTETDKQLLDQGLQRIGGLDPNPIDLSQFGPIQQNIDPTGINFSGANFGGLPSLNAPNLQGSVDLGLNTNNLPGIPQNPDQFRDDVTNAIFERGKGLLDPVFADQERRDLQRRANQGLPESGEAADRDIERFNRSRNEAFSNLTLDAITRGGAEASRSLGDILAARGQGFGEQVTGAGLNLAGGQFANQAGLLGLGAEQGIRGQLTNEQLAQSSSQNQAAAQTAGFRQQQLQNQNAARVQGLGEQQGIRGNQLNELGNVLGFQQTQIPGLENFFAPGNVNTLGANALSAGVAQNAFGANTAQNNALMSGLFGLGAAGLNSPILPSLFPNILGGG